METKALIRKRVLEQRDRMGVSERKEKSRIITEKVMENPAFQGADSILCYVSYQSEVDTWALMGHALEMGKKVYCPKVQGKEMEFYRILSLDDLGEGYKGIREPQAYGEMLFKVGAAQEGHCLMIMPGIAFDKEGNRIGYGGGYYDRYLEKHTGLVALAVCFGMQVQEEIPFDAYDRKTDIIVTECSVCSCGQ